MTRTGVFMRFSVREVASRHCAALSFRTMPVSIAATKTPVPAAESQLMANTAASGLAVTGATGGMRCTRLCSAGICQVGNDRVPPRAEPSSVVLIFTPLNRVFKYAFHLGIPQMAQHAIRIVHGIHAYTVWRTEY